MAAIDRLQCTREGGCQCTAPEEAWPCRYSVLDAPSVLAVDEPLPPRAVGDWAEMWARHDG